MKKLITILAATAVLGTSASACTTASDWITPERAVMMAAHAAPAGIEGVFVLKVQATGQTDRAAYLNSEEDYRDQRNLSVALAPPVLAQLSQRLAADPLSILMGKTILVRGAAVRTRIDILHNGKRTSKYYYQTHVNVEDAAQISVL